MEAIIILAVVGIIWLLVHLNKPDTKFNNALKLISKSKFNEAQEILIKIASKHPLSVTKYSECYFLQAGILKKNGNPKAAIPFFEKVIESKNLLTEISEKKSFKRLAEDAFYEISKIRFNSIYNSDDFKEINEIENNKVFIKSSEYNSSSEIRILIDKHNLRIAKIYFSNTKDELNKGNNREAIVLYNKALQLKSLFIKDSNKKAFNNLIDEIFYEISISQYNSIQKNTNSTAIKDLEKNLEFINSSINSKTFKLTQLINIHNKRITEIYLILGKAEEQKGNFNQAKHHYLDSLPYYANKKSKIYYNTNGRIELCKLKNNEPINKNNFKTIDNSDKKLRDDFYFRITINKIKNENFEDAENYIKEKLDITKREVKKLKKICFNEKIKTTAAEIEKINTLILEIYDSSTSKGHLVELYNSITQKSDDLNKIIPGIKEDLEELKPSLFNRLLQLYNENNEYGNAINLIKNYPDFYNSPIQMKNIGNACFNYLNHNQFTEKNYKILISLFLTSAYSDKVMLNSLEETQWDDEYTFSLNDSLGSNYELHAKIPENVNYDEITESNVSIGEAQKYLIIQFEELINKKELEFKLHKKIIDFYENEKRAIENIIQIVPNEIIFATPHFGKSFKITNSILDELEHDYTEYRNEESLEAGIPYLIDNRDLWIKDYNEAKKTIELLIVSIKSKNVSKFLKTLTEGRKKLINKFDSLQESIEVKLVDALNTLIKKYDDDESVLDLIKYVMDFSPNKEKLKYMYSGYAANLCVSKINANKMSNYKGLQIMSTAYKMASNDTRVCTNLIALVRMNLLDILNQSSNYSSNIYSILDRIKSNRSAAFKNNAGELIKTRDELLNSLPAEARIAITKGTDLNSNGRKLKKGLDYLAQLGGNSSVKDPLASLREQLGINF